MATNPTSWTFQWYIHSPPGTRDAALTQVFGTDRTGPRFLLAQKSWKTCQAHFGGIETSFLPWHRMYVLLLEKIIATLTSKADFALPYWDYTAPQSSSLPFRFQTGSMNDPVYGTLYQANRNVAGGSFVDVNAGAPIAQAIPPGSLNLDAMKETNYANFNQTLDTGLHGLVHGLVGNLTNMGVVPTAANDPIFWMHHCNIDRIWAGWNAAGRSNPTDTAWLNRSFVFSNNVGDEVTLKVKDVASIGALDYAYDSLPTPPVLLAQARPQMDMTILESTAAGRTAASPVPIALGNKPQTVLLRAVRQGATLAQAVPGLTGPRSAYLVLNGVQASAPPGSLVAVYLDLPENATDQIRDQHFVGILNFFSATGMTGMKDAGMQVRFNITDLLQRIGSQGLLTERTSVTFVPLGEPAQGSDPMIMGSVEVRGG